CTTLEDDYAYYLHFDHW
nr:immunoglobulin heavy chain junction region [Macaca mulatta]MOW46426.1 immunoglobulin heavy chain junction region [Macaca mulatta]MOW46868.1 immunoglobulin heavy chain junction region [Macaca mulatta]MOW49161.1 immunoglobulin heavy chain junction region [Macaca mulatta]MOW50059.1 immunoglobulin heavy chain junction region [Macaca mulatta]